MPNTKVSPDKEYEYKKARHKLYYRGLREKIFNAYGGKCECCGENKYEFLSIDHKHGGGVKERKADKGYTTYYVMRRVIKNNFPNTYRILCHNCNQAVGRYGYCPHRGLK